MERNVPLEIIEEILLNLPARSLGRFSAVSKPWKAMISDEEFIRQHKLRASLPGRERILLSHSPRYLMPASARLLSSLSSTRLDSDQPFACPLTGLKFLASCSDMWCVDSWGYFILLNPSMGTYKLLPNPLFTPLMSISSEFSFGMGFDSIADDYKILKVPNSRRANVGSELYSLRSNSWRKIDTLSALCLYKNAVFLSNALHWMAYDDTIVSFDLSTEKCARFVQPQFDPEAGTCDEEDLTVLKGNLCLYLNYHTANRFVLWEMQEDGDGKSLTKTMVIDVCSLIEAPTRGKSKSRTIITPLYLYDNGLILMKATNSKSEDAIIFMVHNDEPHVVTYSYNCGSTSGPLYVKALFHRQHIKWIEMFVPL